MFRQRSVESKPEASSGEASSTTSILAPNVHFEGLLTGDGLVRLEGSYSGMIKNEGHLVIGQTAVVKANVEGNDVTVYGQVEGDVTAHGRLDLKATARVNGKVQAARLSVQEGALLVGKCDVVRTPEAATGPTSGPEVPVLR